MDIEMLILPIAGDMITTKDGGRLTVSMYSNFKSEPAVYVDAPRGEESLFYFRDIEEINGVKVEYNTSTKIFESLGVVKRKFNLPQAGDTITVVKPNAPIDSDDDKAEVKLLKLHNEAIGRSKGLVVLDTDDNVYELPDILSIDREVGTESFDRKKFLKLYKDYLPYGFRIHHGDE
jgi:hypothetical protein